MGGIARAQIEAYFAGARLGFDLALAFHGTPYQQRVWQELRRIPYGETRSYGQIAGNLGRTSPRAVGMASHRNHLPIVVPCHRVIAADGSLSGFAGGLARKRWLLDHEAGQRRLR
ncbi:MAG: methylated-DNA--[protein]-cysteine S-methyltransferase [Planctomycetes bacterium]|nr:methylated-DNA--[protein]-cysteine S-methyltransferase [Planctomycetota bacterium]